MDDQLTKLFESVDTHVREYRRDFHRYAESGWTEFRTASVIANRLQELGYTVALGREVVQEHYRMGLPAEEVLEERYERAVSEGGIAPYLEQVKGGFTGVVGEMRNGEGPTIAFRFDIDAVEVEEEHDQSHTPSREGFRSVHQEAMHSCGHDGHASIGLGVAEVLSMMKHAVAGTIKLIFQPAEEGVRGAKAMVEAGVVDDVDYLVGMHIGVKADTSGTLYCGTEGFLATSKFDAYYKGAAAHAGVDPHKGSNALLSAASAVMNLHAVPRHGEGSTRINVGRLTAGTGRNVIPSDALLVIETRGGNSELNTYMKEYAENIIACSAEMHKTAYSIVHMGEAESGNSDEALMETIHAVAAAYELFSDLRPQKAHLGGSEDFTHMMKRVKDQGGQSTYLMLGSDLKGNHHTSTFDFDETVLIQGVKLLSLFALQPERKKS